MNPIYLESAAKAIYNDVGPGALVPWERLDAASRLKWIATARETVKTVDQARYEASARALVASLPGRALAALRSAWRKNPARLTSAAMSAAVFVAAKFGVVVPAQNLLDSLSYVLPILLGGEITRANVTPTAEKS